MGRFFQLRRRQGLHVTTTYKDDQQLPKEGNHPMRGVVKQLRNRVGKSCWPGSTKTRLSVQNGSTTTEDTDEQSENKYSHGVELVAEVGTDGDDTDATAGSNNESRIDVAFNPGLSTIDEILNLSKSQQRTPMPTARMSSTLTKDSFSSPVSVVCDEGKKPNKETNSNTQMVEKTATSNTKKPQKFRSSEGLKNHDSRDSSSSESSRSSASEDTSIESSLKGRDSVRATVPVAKVTPAPQDCTSCHVTRKSPRSPRARFFWCHPGIFCADQAAEHLLPFEETLQSNSSSGTWSASRRSLHQGVSFIDNVLHHLVGASAAEEDSVLDSVLDSLIDDEPEAVSVMFAADTLKRSERGGSAARPAGEKPRIMDTLAEWDELDNELTQEEEPEERVDRFLSLEFSDSWGQTDDDYTEMSVPSAYTSD